MSSRLALLNFELVIRHTMSQLNREREGDKGARFNYLNLCEACTLQTKEAAQCRAKKPTFTKTISSKCEEICLEMCLAIRVLRKDEVHSKLVHFTHLIFASFLHVSRSHIFTSFTFHISPTSFLCFLLSWDACAMLSLKRY